ncbi:MAG: FadR family transcriptional regulator [Deltaproteobacteria bacterium]|nr:FadR family transcriptional regulator [Deltaproteobacteria bacterium]
MSTVDRQIEESIARRIYRGELPAGTRLPTVRALAAEFSVTVPTIQRAVARLAATGLVTARQGSGITVQDPMTLGDLGVMGALLEACADQPERVGPILADFLELRRVLVVHLIRTRLPRLLGALPGMAEATERLMAATETADIAAADAELSRHVVEAAGNTVVNAVFYAVANLAMRAPAVAEALYGDRPAHNAALMGLVGALAASDGDAEGAAQGVDAALAAWDEITVRRFETG